MNFTKATVEVCSILKELASGGFKSDGGPGAITSVIRSIITLYLHSKLLYFWPSVKKNLHLLEPKLSFARPGFKSLKYSLDKISAEVKLYQVLPR